MGELERLKESETEFYAEKSEKVTSEMSVFYNPRMRENRELSMIIIKRLLKEKAKLHAGKSKKVRLAFPLEASGLRVLRLLSENRDFFTDFLKENSSISFEFHINDINSKAHNAAIKNFDENSNIKELKSNSNLKIIFHNMNAITFLYSNRHFDYIDIDPYGSPNKFIDVSVQSLKDDSVIAVTATDTAALTGTYKDASYRKYWAKTVKSPLMHNTSCRILITKIMMAASQYNIIAMPLISYSHEHYIKIFLRIKKSKKLSSESMRKLPYALICENCGKISGYIDDAKIESMSTRKDPANFASAITYASGEPNGRESSKEPEKAKCDLCGKSLLLSGKVFPGEINDNGFIREIIAEASESKELLSRLLIDDLQKIGLESEVSIPYEAYKPYEPHEYYYFDVHKACKGMSVSQVPKMEKIILEMAKRGFKASRSIYGDTLIRTNAKAEDAKKIIMELEKEMLEKQA